MKSKVVIIIVVLALLVSMLPLSSVLAAKAVPTVLIISHNQTGKTISLVLTPKGGSPFFFSFKPGYSTDTVPEGIYQYYYQTACGIQVGVWNMTRNRTLTTYCAKEGREVNLHSLAPPAAR